MFVKTRFYSESRFILAFSVKEKVSFITSGLHLLLTQTKLFHSTSEESPVPTRVTQGTGTQKKSCPGGDHRPASFRSEIVQAQLEISNLSTLKILPKGFLTAREWSQDRTTPVSLWKVCMWDVLGSACSASLTQVQPWEGTGIHCMCAYARVACFTDGSKDACGELGCCFYMSIKTAFVSLKDILGFVL